MSVHSLTAVAVLDRAPSTDDEGLRVAENVVAQERPESLQDPGLSLSWFTCDRLPPASLTGLPVYEEDQLSAHRRDAGPEAVYLVVTLSPA